MSHVNEDQMLDLAHGFLDGSAREEAVSHLRVCASCEEGFRSVVRSKERGKALWAERIAAEFESSADLETVPRHGRPFSWPRASFRWPLGFAFAAIVAALILLPNRSAEEFPWMPPGSAPIQFRDVEPVNDAIYRGIVAYGARDLERAREILETSEGEGSLETLRKLYLASVLAMQSDEETAIQLLESVELQTVPDPWYTEARWTLYLCLASVDPRRSEALLDELTLEAGTLGDRARSRRSR